MGTITLTLPVAETEVQAGLHSGNYGLIQAVINGNLDQNNFAPTGKIFRLDGVQQGAANAGDGLVWDGASATWKPSSAVKMAVAGLAAGSSGQVLTTVAGVPTWAAATASADAGQELDYAEITADVSVGGATTVLTGNAVTYDGTTKILVEFYASHFSLSTTNSATLSINLYQDGSDIGRIWQANAAGGATAWTGSGIHACRRLTPSAASHTYSIRASQINGTHTINAGAGGSGNVMPAFMRITRV